MPRGGYRGGGRPKKTEEEKLHVKVWGRLSPEQAEKFKALGGFRWLRELIDSTPVE